MRQGNPQGGQACTHSLSPPQILHNISSKCSMDKMVNIQRREVVHVSKALLPLECAIWQPPSFSIDMLRGCCVWYAQEPAQEIQLDLLKFVYATGGD